MLIVIPFEPVEFRFKFDVPVTSNVFWKNSMYCNFQLTLHSHIFPKVQISCLSLSSSPDPSTFCAPPVLPFLYLPSAIYLHPFVPAFTKKAESSFYSPSAGHISLFSLTLRVHFVTSLPFFHWLILLITTVSRFRRMLLLHQIRLMSHYVHAFWSFWNKTVSTRHFLFVSRCGYYHLSFSSFGSPSDRLHCRWHHHHLM